MADIYVWLCAIFVGIGGFFWGFETGTINGVKEMRGFRMTFNLTFNQGDMDVLNQTANGAQCGSEDDVETSALLGAIVSVFSIGALVGALLSGLLSDFAGRKTTVIIGAATCVVGGTLQASSFYLWMLFPGRIISGIGTGILYQACPLYIAEVAPKEKRGAMVSVTITFTLIAAVMSNIINVITKRYLYGWRISLSPQILVGTILAFGALFVPETPRFLLKKHKDAKALKVLTKIYKTEARTQDELDSIKLSLTHTVSKKTCSQSLKYFCNLSIIQQVFIGFTLMLLARAVGPPVIVYYSVAIFCKLGADGFVGTIVLLILMLLSQITGIFLVDKVCGRKSLLLLGAVALGLSLISAAALIQIFDLEDEAASLSVGRRVAGYFVIGFICLMMSINNISYGSVVFIVLSEVYPLRIRGIGTALGQLGWWGGTFIVGELGPVLLSSPLKTSGTLYLLSGMCLLAFLHVLLLLPETKGRSLEDIEVLFTESWLKRTDIVYYLRCGYFCCFSRRRRRQVQIEPADSEEREQLQEPLDQISLSSVDSIEPDDEHRTDISTL